MAIVLKKIFREKSHRDSDKHPSVYQVGHGGPITAKLEISIENSNRDKNYRT